MNLEQARYNMIEQQIRPWDVLDQTVLDLLARIARDEYVPTDYRKLAYADIEIPLDHGQVMMAPRIEARLLQGLGIRSSDSILEIGTGSGYLTALLANIGRHVFSVDIFPDFLEQAQRKLSSHGIGNVTLEEGDGSRRWTQGAPYDVVVITGSVPILPEAYKNILRPGGRLFAVVGQAPVMEAIIMTRIGDDEWHSESLFETELPTLIGAQQPPQFSF